MLHFVLTSTKHVCHAIVFCVSKQYFTSFPFDIKAEITTFAINYKKDSVELNIIIADNQDITYAGMLYICNELQPEATVAKAEDKASLVERLVACGGKAVVVVDYTLFDINDVDELLIFSQRFTDTHWVLFSEDLSRDFVKRLIVMSQKFSIIMKESPMYEIKAAIKNAISGKRYICQRMAELLLMPDEEKKEKAKLTPTETEILKEIANGLTTKEIAEKRISSFHTVNTHRKNIFRKLGVNNVHEATKYALRAGLVDSAEYYI